MVTFNFLGKLAWNAFDRVTDNFRQLLADADINDTVVVSLLERHLIIMYGRTTDVNDLNSTRRFALLSIYKTMLQGLYSQASFVIKRIPKHNA